MEELEEVLQELGLTNTETSLYTALLWKKEGTASEIAKKAGVNRRLAYDKFETLQEKGLVNYIDKENKRVYRPATPERVKEILDDKKTALKELENKAEEVLPEALKQFNSETSEREVKVMTGKEGIKHVFNDELRQEETIYIIGGPKESEEKLEYFLPTWTKKRAEKGVEIKGIFEHEMRGMVGQRAPLEDRYLPEGLESKVSISIYGDKVSIIFWIQDPLTIKIKDSEAAESFMSYFKLAWKAAEP